MKKSSFITGDYSILIGGLGISGLITACLLSKNDFSVRCFDPLSKRINSPNFYNNAPEDVINKENERLNQQNKRISQLEERGINVNKLKKILEDIEKREDS